MDSIAQGTIVRKILQKLPTKDVARCRCVSLRWRSIVADPSFRALHGAANASSGGDDMAENLLVYEVGRGATVDMVVLSSPSSARPMCRVDLVAVAGYRPANACNGFLLLAPRVQDWPVCICNPVTGEKLYLSAPPVAEHGDGCTYALGFSPATLQYKLFRLYVTPHGNYMDVGTLGGSGDRCRRHPDRLPDGAISPATPTLLDGKLYFACDDEGILVIDVASEMHHTYPIPKYEGEKAAAAVVFELRGRLCVAVHVVGRRQKIDFWVMPSRLGEEKKEEGTSVLHWELRYSFHMDDGGGDGNRRQRGAWLDDGDGMLWYRMNDRLFKYDTTKNDHSRQVGGLLQWDDITQLPKEQLRWNVYGGYRPSPVSPRLALASLQHRRREELEESFSRAWRDQISSKKPSLSM